VKNEEDFISANSGMNLHFIEYPTIIKAIDQCNKFGLIDPKSIRINHLIFDSIWFISLESLAFLNFVNIIKTDYFNLRVIAEITPVRLHF